MADLGIGEEAGGASGGTGGAVRIPIVPTVAAPLRDAPPISRWRGSGIPATEPVQTQDIFEGIEAAGEKLGKIFAAQGQNQRSLQANKLAADFDLADTQARVTASTTGSYMGTDPNNMVSLYRQQTDDQMQKMLQDPANKGVLADPALAAQVQSRLHATQNKGIGDMALNMAKSAMQDQEAQLKSQTHVQAITAGADYSVAPDGSIIDGPKALQAKQDVQTLIGQVKGHLPGEAAADQQAFNLDLASERAQSIAQNTSQPFLLDKFVKSQPSGTFTPQQLSHFTEMQRSAIKAPYDQVMAVHDAKAASAIQQLNQMQDAHDPNLAAQANQAKLADLISDAQYTAYTGAKFRAPNTPSAPGLVDKYMKDIQTDPYKYSSQDITGISSDDINPNDRRALQAALHDGQEAVKKPLGAAVTNSYKQIRDSLTPTMMEATPAQKMKIDNAVEDMRNAAASGQFKTPQDAIDARDQIIKAYGGRSTPPPKFTVDPKKIAPTLSPATAAAIAKKARAAGFDPSVGD
jgi:hypothetical protein